MFPPRVEHVQLIRNRGRLVRAECLDRGGNVLCEMPLMGYSIDYPTMDADGTASLYLHAFRVAVKESQDV